LFNLCNNHLRETERDYFHFHFANKPRAQKEVICLMSYVKSSAVFIHRKMTLKNIFFFYYSYVHTMFGSFLPPSPCPVLYRLPPSSPLLPPRYQAETILPLCLILFKKEYKQQYEGPRVLLVEIRIAIQGVDLYCFPVHMCYILNKLFFN
jgi:hypothetical protein